MEKRQRFTMNFAAFISYVLLTTFTPGPNNIMAMTNASKYGFKSSVRRFNLGVFFGVMIITALAAAFASLLYDVIPSVKPVMLAIGAAYILWLAWTVWRDKPHDQRKGLSQTNSIPSGMALQFVNVKVILYSITVMSSFVLPNYHDVLSIALFVPFLATVSFTSTCCWAVFGAVFERFFKAHGKLINAIMALLLIYCAVTMILDIWR